MVWASLRKAAPSFVVGHIGSGAGTGGRNNMGRNRRRGSSNWASTLPTRRFKVNSEGYLVYEARDPSLFIAP